LLIAWLALGTVLGMAQDAAQDPGAVSRPAAPAAQESTNDLKINIGIAAAKPGDPIDIPVTLSGGEGAQIGGAVIHVGYPTATFSFNDAERGLAVELADGQAKATVAQDKTDAKSSVIELALTGTSCIKPGILAYLKFQVSNDAKKSEVPLKLLDYKATGCQNAPLQLAKGDDGLITIFAIDEEIPVIGCFFFTH
jgi:hypothetical protein